MSLNPKGLRLIMMQR